MLTFKDWLTNKPKEEQFIPLEKDFKLDLIKSIERIKDGHEFRLNNIISMGSFRHKDKPITQRIEIVYFWENLIDVTIEISALEVTSFYSEKVDKILASEIQIIQANDISYDTMVNILKDATLKFKSLNS